MPSLGVRSPWLGLLKMLHKSILHFSSLLLYWKLKPKNSINHLQKLLSERSINTYNISSYSLRRNYSFLNSEIVANSNTIVVAIIFFYLLNLTFAAETIQGRKLENYMRKYGI